MAAVGIGCGVPVFDSAMRALGGAAVAYFVTRFAVRIVVGIMVEPAFS